MTTTESAREDTAARLLAASARRSYDPAVDIDWNAPLPEGMYHWPPERMSLYGTALWDGLTEEQRVELSHHEATSMASTGIWFEMFSIQMLIRYVYRFEPTEAHPQYALTEMGDECRHIVMFGRSIEAAGAKAYRLSHLASVMGRIMAHTAWGPSLLATILTAEELTDTFQRETMVDERLQPMVRGVGRIHVVEEARHVQWAREEVTRLMAQTGWFGRAVHRVVLAGAAFVVARGLINPRVYESVGLSRRKARRAALANPNYAATLRWAAAKVVSYLDEVGLIGGPSKLIWRLARLI
ncbi:diiron oxygenase [Solihabitans fulvus]|uniref:Diiron oxygenase n=1 Tax=Solihabitans fulvus TaxID=1892852 RepID=A0A5B2WJN5_9PSEU|nr:diiron oxygenase [Solihabitans fulvus]KAA2250970.1 diiron oxygenase [Solihabitans fulvus]